MDDEQLNNKERAKYHIVIDEDTYQKLMQCKKEYLKHHPEADGKNITNKLITKQAFLHYLRTP
ncbi:hypothetical protein CMI37_37180 [Candidatus Pacearchaeota archaeon]|nr:hypothetical protein [Candidatus Pacearchaeota archaeon]